MPTNKIMSGIKKATTGKPRRAGAKTGARPAARPSARAAARP